MALGAGQGQRWIDELGLVPLPGESGWWRLADTSALEVRHDGVPLPAFSSIYYLLDARRPINVWHHLDSDDTHVLIDGGPVEYVMLREGQAPAHCVLGRDLTAGQMPMLTARGGTWKALRLADPGGFALIATVVTPGWTPDRVRIGLPADQASRWVDVAPWLTTDLIDALGRP